MSNSPTVSVVIPSYNRTTLTARAVASALAQDLAPIEVIVVDDASIDPVTIKALGVSDDRVKVVRFDVNQGGGAARNRGAKEAAGNYIAFLDSDDEWRSDKLRRQLDIASQLEGESWIIYNTVVRVERDKSSTIPRRPYVHAKDDLSEYLLVEGNMMQTSGLLMPRQTALKHQFDPTLRRHQDLDLVLRMAKGGIQFHHCAEPTVVWHSNADDHSRVSSGRDAGPTVDWILANPDLITRRAAAELWGTVVAPRIWKRHPIKAIGYLAKSIARHPAIGVRILKRLHNLSSQVVK